MDDLIWIGSRAFIHYSELECYKHGYFSDKVCGHGKEQIRKAWALLLDADRFSQTCNQLIASWPNTSAVHLTGSGMNRRAWLGRISSFYLYSCCESCVSVAWARMDKAEQARANSVANNIISEWIESCEKETCQKQRSQLELMS